MPGRGASAVDPAPPRLLLLMGALPLAEARLPVARTHALELPRDGGPVDVHEPLVGVGPECTQGRWLQHACFWL